MEAIVLAGALAAPDLRERGIERVPLLHVAGETILQRTCRALIDGGLASRVLVLAPEEVPLPEAHGAARIERGAYTGELLTDITAAVRGMHGTHMLCATGDMPLLTAESVAAVVDVAQRSGADLVYPVVEREVMEAALPGGQRTYRRLGKRTLTAGNLFYANRDWTLRSEPLLRSLFEMRKDPMALARFFGLGFAMRVMGGSISLEEAEAHLAKKLGVKLHAPTLPFPELAADLDKAADLETFREWLEPA